MLYEWNDGKFEEEYLKKLERNWRRWKTVSLEEKPQERGNVKFTNSGLGFFLYFSFLFSFQFVFLFSIFKTTRVRVDLSCCHISHNLIA